MCPKRWARWVPAGLALLALAGGVVAAPRLLQAQAPEPETAIVGATVIDGNEGDPLPDATILVRGRQIAAVGPRGAVTVPPWAMHMTPEELRVAMNAYLDRGVDFVKYAGTWHINYPTLIAFSPRAQRVIVEETQERGLVAETDSTMLEGLWMSIQAGIDLIQHSEVVGHREITDELVDLIVERKIIDWT